MESTHSIEADTNSREPIVVGDVRLMPPQPPSSFCGDCAEPEDVPPTQRIIIPSDVADFTPADESIYIIGTREGKVTKIAGLENMRQLKVITFWDRNCAYVITVCCVIDARSSIMSSCSY